jgi:hypothetical protein
MIAPVKLLDLDFASQSADPDRFPPVGAFVWRAHLTACSLGFGLQGSSPDDFKEFGNHTFCDLGVVRLIRLIALLLLTGPLDTHALPLPLRSPTHTCPRKG